MLFKYRAATKGSATPPALARCAGFAGASAAAFGPDWYRRSPGGIGPPSRLCKPVGLHAVLRTDLAGRYAVGRRYGRRVLVMYEPSGLCGMPQTWDTMHRKAYGAGMNGRLWLTMADEKGDLALLLALAAGQTVRDAASLAGIGLASASRGQREPILPENHTWRL
jgi:hypothetical protein